MELLAGLSAINAAIGIGKSVVQAEHAIDTATLKTKLADMMSELANAKIAQTELIEELKKLNDEVKRLLNAGGEIAALTVIDSYPYPTDENGSAIGWPYCPKCLSLEMRLSSLVQHGDEVGAKCPHCDTEFRPVTSFVSPGFTRLEQRREKRARQSAEATAAIQRNRRDWMA